MTGSPISYPCIDCVLIMSMPAAILACLAAHLTCSAAFVPLPFFCSRSESRRSANFAERSLGFRVKAERSLGFRKAEILVAQMSATRPESYNTRSLVELDPKSKKVLNTDASASASGLAGSQPKITSPKFDDVCEFTGVTLSRFMSAVSRENPELRDLETLISGIKIFYYEQQIKRELKGIHIRGCRCNERLQAKTDGSTRLAYTGLTSDSNIDLYVGVCPFVGRCKKKNLMGDVKKKANI